MGRTDLLRLLHIAIGLAAALYVSLPTGSASADSDRVALVIGNGAYRFANHLPNPPNDAADFARALRDIGFDVVEGIDLDRRGMEDKIRAFGDRLGTARTALFFYAGHGMQVAGRNYLIPTDAKLQKPGDLSLDTIDVQVVLEQMESRPRVNLVFLDACRDNPLARSFASTLGASRSVAIGQGLASIQSAVGTMIAFATQPDAVALDGSGRNSPFTAALLKHIREPGVDIAVMMRRVRTDVLAATNQQQVPWDHSSLTDTVMLVPGSPQTASPAAPASPAPPPRPPEQQLAIRTIPSVRPPPRASGVPCATYSAPAGSDRYCASSMLAPQFGNSYGVQNLFSPQPDTAWVEGKAGQGNGEWVSVEFDAERLVKAVVVRNGYQKNDDIYAKNSRVRRLRLVFSQGESLTFTLQDHAGPQTITLDHPINAHWIEFVIDDVYPGSRYSDTAISKLYVTSEQAH
jgi:hypothetical protein